MELPDFLDALDVELELTRYSNQEGLWCARFASCEIKDDCILISAHGNGKTPVEAVNDYISEIRGKRMVMHAMSKEMRREFNVPVSIENVKELSY